MGYTNKIIKSIANSIGRLMPDKMYLALRYYMTFHKRINWKNPQTFNEKLQLMKLYDRNQLYLKLVDKYEIRVYIREFLGEEYLIKCLGVWNSFDEIDFENLSNQFVLKCTHDSGSVLICENKDTFDMYSAKKHLEGCLKRDNYYGGREWPYKYVKPRIIAEELISSEDGDLKDYKFFCFNGIVKCFKVDFDRHTNHHANYYDRKMNQLPFGEKYFPPNFDRKIAKPDKLDLMISMAEKLANEIPFVRIDFYYINSRIYFGEMTFYPACGFEEFVPGEWDNVLGNWLDISDIRK